MEKNIYFGALFLAAGMLSLLPQQALYAQSGPNDNRAAVLDLNSGDNQMQLGMQLLQRGRPEEAVAHLSEALKEDPNNADLYYYLGLANAQLGRYAQARSNYEQTLKHRPDDINAIYGLGAAFVQECKISAAMEQLKRAENIAAENPSVVNLRNAINAIPGKTVAEKESYCGVLETLEDLRNIPEVQRLAPMVQKTSDLNTVRKVEKVRRLKKIPKLV